MRRTNTKVFFQRVAGLQLALLSDIYFTSHVQSAVLPRGETALSSKHPCKKCKPKPKQDFARDKMAPVARSVLSWLTALCLALFCMPSAVAQITSMPKYTRPLTRPTARNVELLGTTTAEQVSSGLGFVVSRISGIWEFAAAAQAGATHVRFQCSWTNVEEQSAPPNNRSSGFIQDPDCVSGFNSALNPGLKVTVVAAYGPPFHQILEVTVPGGAAAGATSLRVEFASGVGGDTLANIAFPYDYIIGANGSQFTGRHNYQGSFITGAK